MENREWFTQLPFIFVVSVCGGLLGALFNWAHEKIFAVSLTPDLGNHQNNCLRLSLIWQNGLFDFPKLAIVALSPSAPQDIRLIQLV